MAYSRDDFLAALQAEVQSRPTAALYYQAGDPRLLAQMGAQATMLAMISQQIDAVGLEGFQKLRDSTVLADATMKGILPFASPPRMTLNVVNASAVTLPIVVGRQLFDQYGHTYVVEAGATLAAGQAGTINVKQMTTRTILRTVANTTAFYPVQVTPSTDTDLIISGVTVAVDGVSYPYTPEFANLAAGAPGFTLETDEYRALWVKFGWKDTFGIQPDNGAVVSLTIEETYGATNLAANAPFTLAATGQVEERQLTFTLASVIFQGSNPVDMDTMRDWAQYPSTYDSSAVYLGNFDFLLRRNLPPLRFLSVWNEQIEESVRGASVASINCLFVAALMDGVDQAWLDAQIDQVIAAADDSYRRSHVAAVEVPLPLTVNAQVSVVYDPGEVEKQIRDAVATLYGKGADATKRGMLKLNAKKISAYLAEQIPALQSVDSDLQVVVGDAGAALPEQYRYVSDASLTVNVTTATYNDGMWSH